jgi:hypothetical protein
VRPAKAGAFSGSQSRQGKSQSPVARIAGRRVIDDLKPIDNAIIRMVSESSGRSDSERRRSLESRQLQGPTCEIWVKAAWDDTHWLTCQPTLAG